MLTEAKNTLQFHLKWLMSAADGDEKAKDLRRNLSGTSLMSLECSQSFFPVLKCWGGGALTILVGK